MKEKLSLVHEVVMKIQEVLITRMEQGLYLIIDVWHDARTYRGS